MGKDVYLEYSVSGDVKRKEADFKICHSRFASYTDISVEASCVLC